MLTKIVLPGSVPTMISTLKVNVGLALVGVVVGEFQAAKAGLGFLIVYGSQIFQMNLVMTAMIGVLAGDMIAAVSRHPGAGGDDAASSRCCRRGQLNERCKARFGEPMCRAGLLLHDHLRPDLNPVEEVLICSLTSRNQPEDTACPIVSGALVPWMRYSVAEIERARPMGLPGPPAMKRGR